MKPWKFYTMKKKLFTLILILCTATCFAQSYYNEWINPSQTYFKFKVGADGLYRIPQASLATVGLASAPAEQFKLWRNGQEVPLYTSVPTGPLPVNGYIEFWGLANDGKPDKVMYRDPAYQHVDKRSLQTDTAMYFLTLNTTSPNLRINTINNDIAGNSLPPEPYFMYTSGKYFRDGNVNAGFAAVVGEYVYSSSYDKGEFWCSRPMRPGVPVTAQSTSLFPSAAGPATATLKFGGVGNALNTRSFQASINGSLLKDTVCDYFNDFISTVDFPVSLINSGTADMLFATTAIPTSNDRAVLSFYEITYPRQFNFGGQTNFDFVLPAKSQGYYLQITNFNGGSAAPVLYDFTYNERYIGDVSTPGVVQFAIHGGTADRKMVLVSEHASHINTIAGSAIKSKTFIDFNNVSNQAAYLIISSPLLYNGTNGVNPINEYKLYRSSAAGGGYNTKIIDIDELVDQFAYGIRKHPLSIKNFLRFARAKFATAPQYVLLIGHGLSYNEFLFYQSYQSTELLNMVPTWGWPASDNMLASADAVSAAPLTYIGRISAVSPQEVENYLEKLKEYEAAQKNSPNTVAGRAWMKNIIHVTGASDSYLGSVLCSYMESYKEIAEDTSLGAAVTVFCKSSGNEVTEFSNDHITRLFNEGLSLVTYFGHSSSTTLEFNLDNPQTYNNQGKYPIFSVNGCNAGNFFTFDEQRLGANQSLSELFTLAKQRGGMAFLASTHFGIVNYLNIYLNSMYTLMGKDDYGAPLGKLHRDACGRMIQIAGTSDFYARINAEELTIHGDPALKFNFQALPDYAIENQLVKITPQFISIAEDQFRVNMKIYNLGKAYDDSITVEIKQQYPDNSIAVLARKRIKGIHYIDSLFLDIPLVATRDKGLNKLIITVDADNEVTEITKANNSITQEFYVYEDEAKPAYPYTYSIVNQPNAKLYVSTANPFSNLKKYAVQVDTTIEFNSPLKVEKTISSVGGMLEFDPGIIFKDSTVYYWRTSFVPDANGEFRWNNASFLYLKNSSTGFNQSHYYQHINSTFDHLYIDNSRQWKFATHTNNIYARNGVYPYSGTTDNDFSVTVNGETSIRSACVGASLIFNVFDPVTFKAIKNVDENANNLHLYGSGSANCADSRYYNLEFTYMDSVNRINMVHCMDSIKDGSFVLVRNIPFADPAANKYIDEWKKDTAVLGHNNSLYHRLMAAGMLGIDSFYRPRSFIFIYKKGDPSFTPKYVVSDGISDRIQLTADCATADTLGYVESPKFGPAKAWKTVHWRGTSMDALAADIVSVSVIGVSGTGVETPLYELQVNQQDFDISSISASQYPYLKLKMRNMDSVFLTPYQLRYWRIDYDEIPEGALIPNVYFKSKTPAANVDSLDIGEPLNFGIAFKNISSIAFDSLKIKLYILDRNNVKHDVLLQKRKPLIAGDSVRFDYQVETKDYAGMNTLYIDFNPDGDQAEQFHFNNFLFRNFYVRPDKVNPLLDVTFDNVHILNKDIVSAKPHIQIKLKDDAKFMLLNDTAGMTVQLRFPDNNNNTIRTYRFDGDTLRFTPAASGADNTASIDFYPQFLNQVNPEGDEYELIVTGKDRSDNKAGSTQYNVTFKVISKPMISNLLNYPNPFTTSTAFVFTVTGSEVPQNMKIQILTVTGKIVREITKEELGPLHIGRNITDFKWDGTDQYGQRLANGVYLYRFVTQLNGIKMDKYKAEGDNTDKYFKGGYGKMYLMR